MTEESTQASSDLIRWLKMLALPVWAKGILALIMALILACGLGLLVWGLFNGKTDLVSSSVAMLTVGLPIGLIVVALVFGDGGAAKLQVLTQKVLAQEIPHAILQNFESAQWLAALQNPSIAHTAHGCIADYSVSAACEDSATGASWRKNVLEFTLALNVRKANLVVWIPAPETGEADDMARALAPYQSCFFGAAKEGYVQNAVPLTGSKNGHIGVVLIKTLPDDFLLNPAERLYFAQDLAFFIRGLLNSDVRNG